MKYFLRAIKLSFVNKWSIAMLMVNSLLIGVLWGGSITAIYPFVEVVFSGKTIETWLDQEIEKSDVALAEVAAERAEIDQRLKTEGRTLELRDCWLSRKPGRRRKKKQIEFTNR